MLNIMLTVSLIIFILVATFAVLILTALFIIEILDLQDNVVEWIKRKKELPKR